MIVKCKNPVATIFLNLIGFIVMASAPIVIALIMGVQGNGQWAAILCITLIVIVLWIRDVVKYARKKSAKEVKSVAENQ